MTQIVCDKCGKETKDEGNLSVYEPHYCTHGDGHRFVTKISYDLCDECLMKIVHWIGGKTDDSNSDLR